MLNHTPIKYMDLALKEHPYTLAITLGIERELAYKRTSHPFNT
jgi:hypothetical protein